MKDSIETGFVQILEAQIAVLEGLATAEKVLQQAVMDRDWPDAEARIIELRVLSRQFEALERDRSNEYKRLSQAVSAADSTPFGAILSRLDEATRRRLTELYRDLKVSLFRVRSLGEGLDAFLNALVATTRGILDELYPSRKGRLYRKTGEVAGAEDWALVVNHSL